MAAGIGDSVSTSSQSPATGRPRRTWPCQLRAASPSSEARRPGVGASAGRRQALGRIGAWRPARSRRIGRGRLRGVGRDRQRRRRRSVEQVRGWPAAGRAPSSSASPSSNRRRSSSAIMARLAPTEKPDPRRLLPRRIRPQRLISSIGMSALTQAQTVRPHCRGGAAAWPIGRHGDARARLDMDVWVEIHCEACGSANYSLPAGERRRGADPLQRLRRAAGDDRRVARGAAGSRCSIIRREALRRDLDRLLAAKL